MGLLSLPVRENRSSDSLNGATALHPKDPALAELWGFNKSASNQNVTSDTAMRVSTVYSCVSILSDTLAMLEKYIKRVREDGGKDIVYNHRLYKLIHNTPNRWQSGFDFFKMMESHRQLRGNAYARIVAFPGRGLNELVPMHPDRVWPFIITPSKMTYYMSYNSPPPPAGSKLYYQYMSPDGGTEILMADEVFKIMGYSVNGIMGMNPIMKNALESVGLSMAAEEQGARLFANGAQIPYAFKYPGRIDDITFKRMKEDLEERLLGAHNKFKPFPLEEGMDIVKLGLTMVDAQYLELRGFQVEDIARFYKMPLFVLGHGDKAPTYASSEQFFILFKVITMQPNVKCWEDSMERDLLYPSEINNIKIDFDLDTIMRGDAAARMTYLKGRFETASITPRGIQLFEQENPSSEEGADKLYIMSNMVPLKDAGIRMRADVKPAGETEATPKAAAGGP